MYRHFILGFFLLSISLLTQAETEKVFVFKSNLDETRYHSMIAELRCPKCQNQNLADSNAAIAIDLKNHVYNMINSGVSDAEIVNYMVARYGEFVLYRPQKNSSNFILWYGPFIILGIGLLGFVFVILGNAKRRRNKKGRS